MKSKLLAISTFTLVGLYALLSVIILGVCLFTGTNMLIGLGISIIVLIVQFLIAPWLTDLSMKWFYKAKFGAEIPSYLNEFVDGICTKYNMKKPKFAIIDDGAPNAYFLCTLLDDDTLCVFIFKIFYFVDIQILLIQSMVHFDINKADVIRRQIDETEIDLSNENVNNLLNELFSKFKRGEKQEKKKKKRKKKIRYPKNYDPKHPGPMPDPERWLPKMQKKKYRAKNKLAHQGAVEETKK